MSPRYAVYYAPPRDSALDARASAWLGREAWTGREVKRPVIAGLEGLDLDDLTRSPRHYGFHATLKAPFELAAWASEDGLVAATAALASSLAAFTAPMAPAALGRFLAFRLTGAEEAMRGLHDACLEALEPFRAPITEADIERRRRSGLTPLQDERMLRYGYPYIYEDFRFHMTLTGSIAQPQVLEQVLTALKRHFAADSGEHCFDGLCVFRQPDRKSPFVIIERLAFGAP